MINTPDVACIVDDTVTHFGHGVDRLHAHLVLKGEEGDRNPWLRKRAPRVLVAAARRTSIAIIAHRVAA